MGKISGITYIKDDSGKAKFITIDLDIWGNEVEDFLDNIEAIKRRKEPKISWEEIKIENYNWSEWFDMPEPNKIREIKGPENNAPGLYQIKNFKTNEFVLFGIGGKCRERMKSLYPKPYGSGTRNNETKRIYCLENWGFCKYRFITTNLREEASAIEAQIKRLNIHLFNT